MATYHMAVFETAKAIDAVQALAKELDGYLVRRDDTSIIVRIPSERYRGALERVGKLGDVLHREETVEDVTEQFMDLLTRLKNARAVRQRLEQLLVQAKNVTDALEVERELARLTADIEVMEGKLKRLRELVAFSTITVRFEPVPTEQITSNVRLPFPWLDRLGLQNLLDL
jgi:predicted  nucleic acid-binding Zn-ribbon protein